MRSPTLVFGLACAVVAATAALAVPTASSAATSTTFTGAQGTYYPVGPTRILDTRNGTGTGGHIGQVGAAKQIVLDVTGVGGVPSTGVSAVVFNLTVTGPTAKSGYVTAYPDGLSRPTASSINYVKSWTGANLVTVPVGTDGKVDLYNSTGSVSLVADMVGWYADASGTGSGSTGDQFVEVLPQRLVDTRKAGGPGTMHAGNELFVPVDYNGSIPGENSHIKALAVTITATDEKASSGYLTAWNGSNPSSPPATSTLNFRTDVTVPNMAIVPVLACPSTCGSSAGLPSIAVYNASSNDTQVLVDIWGFYDDGADNAGLRFSPLSTPTRIVDTRSSLGTTKLTAASTHTVVTPGSVADADTFMLNTNVTAVKPSATTYLTLWANSGAAQPTNSNLNPRTGITVADAAVVAVGNNNDFNVYNNKGSVDLIVDVNGTFESP